MIEIMENSLVASDVPAICQNLELLQAGWERRVKKKQSGGLMGRALRLFESRYEYEEVSRSLSSSATKLGRDWVFLKIFEESIFRGGATEVIDHKALSKKLYAVVDEVHMSLLWSVTNRRNHYLKRPQELLSLLGNCQRKTDELCKSEIRKALEDLSSFTFLEHSADSKFWKEFVPSATQNLRAIKDAAADDCVLNKQVGFLLDEMEWIQRYIGDVENSRRGSDLAIHVFLTHVASVVLRIAVRSCDFWFNKTDLEIAKVKANSLLDLHWEMDPTNPEFLQLNLRFQEALFKISSKTTTSDESVFVGYFCSYLLIWIGEGGLCKELMSLVSLYINTTLEDGEDVQSFFAEIKAVLGEASFSHRTIQREATYSHHADGERNLTPISPPCSELRAKICLLKAELFLKEQLNTNTSSMIFSGDHFFKVDMFLTNLRAFAKELSQLGSTEYVKQSLALADELANEVESLQISLQSKRMTETLVKHLLLQLLFKIVFFKAESFLTELLKSSDTLVAHEKEQIDSLVEKLKFFKRIVTNKLARNLPDEETIILQVEAVVRGISLFSYSFLPQKDQFKKMILSLPQLLDKVTVIKAKIEKIRQHFPKSSFPKTNEMGFIDFLGRNISELLKYDPESVAPVKHLIVEAQLHLDSLRSFLMKEKDLDIWQGELKDLHNRIIDVAYKLEYVVESIEVDGHLQQSIWLYDLLEDIRLVDQQVSKIQEMSYAGEAQILPQISSQMISWETAPEIHETLVDLVDEEQVLMERLIGGFPQQDVVSIVGMPGIGKTTLAKKLYNNQDVLCHFHRHAWCTVSKVYSKRELLLEILSHIDVLTNKIRQMTDDGLQLELRRKLLTKKYLVVMDDVWSIETWNDLKHSFPDDSNGSRILITSRCQDVVSEIKPDSDPHLLRLFSDDESWMLLENKIFQSKACPEKLLSVGEKIAQQCQGLPLAVVAMAGVLQNTEWSLDWWEKISKSLCSEINNDPKKRCMEILELSYKSLPGYLKACFLYFGVFLEDRDIPVSKLIRFWMAEGFIQETKFKCLEEVAEDYLLALINRGLVDISKKRSSGKVKACRLNDLLRELCHLKSKEENFLQQVTVHDTQYASFSNSDYGMEFDKKNQLAPVTFESYRLSFLLKRSHFVDSRPTDQEARSLIFFASADSEPKCPYDISFICHNFKLLKMLDLECIMASNFPVEIGLMVQLRYLSISGYMQSIPPSIESLWKLETLIVKGLRGKVTLPETIWSMARLKYLHVNDHVAFSLNGLDEQVGDSFLCLENLVSFSTPSLFSGKDTLSILKRMLNLRKLRCRFMPSWDSSEDCSEFSVLKFLTHLESLKIIYHGGALHLGEFILPFSIKKLTLSKFCLQLNHLSAIGQLPNLEVLKLHAGAFQEETWEMKEQEFKQLKFLELDTMNIAKWNASYGHLPGLERLVLRNCKHLERIPSDFACIAKLKKIEVQWCWQSVEVSAKVIGDTTKGIKVFISYS